MKRFYKSVSVGKEGDSFVVLLDKSRLVTPLRAPLLAPTETMAQAVAAEWERQGETIFPDDMPVTQLLNTLTDKVATDRQALREQIVRYAHADLVCYFADYPESLVRAQERAWLPVHEWLAKKGIVLKTTRGIRHEEQAEESIEKIAALVDGLDDYAFTALQAVVPVLGSVSLGLMLVVGDLAEGDAFAASTVDETWQAAQWGADPEVQKKMDRQLRELESAVVFLKASL